MNRPDIVLIYIDDMGWRDLACSGSPFYETPVIDRLAREGMRFTDAYAACPVCSPSRASLLTGKYPARAGVTDWIGAHTRGMLEDADYLRHLRDDEYTLPQALKDGGYHTWHVGKWHLGERPHYPTAYGFEVNIGGCEWGHPKRGYFAPWGIPTLPEGEPGAYLTDRLTDEAVSLIDNCDERPFFLNLWHYAVHTPCDAPSELLNKYRAKASNMGLDDMTAFVEGEAFPCEHKKDQRVKRRVIQSDPNYAAMIESLDSNVGRVLDALERKGRLKNALIIFTSDNGGLATAEGSPTCNSPLAEGKGWAYEGGVRVPLIARWDGRIQAGSVCGAPVITPDLYPTLLEAAGLSPIPEQHMDGVSFMPALRGEPFERQKPLIWHYPHYGNQGGTPVCAIRSGDWKLIHFFEDDSDMLYNLSSDISETADVASKHPALCQSLRDTLLSSINEMQAKIPRKAAGYRPWQNRGDGKSKGGAPIRIRPMAVSVKPIDDYMLYLIFDNGERRIFDVKPYIEGDWFGELMNPDVFKAVRVAGLSIEWPGGQDICPDCLYEQSMPASAVLEQAK